jgi:DNA-binding helix-hairpin-helix protein with protein kinase domain
VYFKIENDQEIMYLICADGHALLTFQKTGKSWKLIEKQSSRAGYWWRTCNYIYDESSQPIHADEKTFKVISKAINAAQSVVDQTVEEIAAKIQEDRVKRAAILNRIAELRAEKARIQENRAHQDAIDKEKARLKKEIELLW